MRTWLVRKERVLLQVMTMYADLEVGGVPPQGPADIVAIAVDLGQVCAHA